MEPRGKPLSVKPYSRKERMKTKTKTKGRPAATAGREPPAASQPVGAQPGAPAGRSYGWIIVVAVAALAVGIVWYRNRQPAYEVAETVSQAQAALPGASSGSAPPTAAAAGNPSADAPADPMPTDPSGQLSWAMRNGKSMMVLFHSATCIPCKEMERLVAKVRGDFEPTLVFIDVLTDNPRNLALIRQAGIQAIPTTYFLDPTGAGQRFVGAMKEEDLRQQLTALMEGS